MKESQPWLLNVGDHVIDHMIPPPPLPCDVRSSWRWMDRGDIVGREKSQAEISWGCGGPHTNFKGETEVCVGRGGSSMACWERMAISPLEFRDVLFLMASPVRQQQRVWGKRRGTQLPPSDLWTPPLPLGNDLKQPFVFLCCSTGVLNVPSMSYLRWLIQCWFEQHDRCSGSWGRLQEEGSEIKYFRLFYVFGAAESSPQMRRIVTLSKCFSIRPTSVVRGPLSQLRT